MTKIDYADVIEQSVKLHRQVADSARTVEVQRASEMRIDVLESLNHILDIAKAMLINDDDKEARTQLVNTLREHVSDIRKRMDIG